MAAADETAGRFAEAGLPSVVAGLNFDRRADRTGQRAFGQRRHDSALGDVVGGVDQPIADGSADGGLSVANRFDVNLRQLIRQRLAAQLRKFTGRQRRFERADQRDRLALLDETKPTGTSRVGQQADHADHRRWVNRPRGSLVVERNIAADDRRFERSAGIGDCAYSLG